MGVRTAHMCVKLYTTMVRRTCPLYDQFFLILVGHYSDVIKCIGGRHACCAVCDQSCVQCDNMAREGLRTLVVAKKTLTEEQYADFEVCQFYVASCWSFHMSVSECSAFDVWLVGDCTKPHNIVIAYLFRQMCSTFFPVLWIMLGHDFC